MANEPKMTLNSSKMHYSHYSRHRSTRRQVWAIGWMSKESRQGFVVSC